MSGFKVRSAWRHVRHGVHTGTCLLRSYLEPGLVHRDQTEWLFLLTPPNSGSTALARLLQTAPGVVCLNQPAEGQWLVPELRRPLARWDPEHEMPYRKIRAVWLSRLKWLAPRGPVLVIEKTPSNLCRYQDFVQAFATMRPHVVTLIRDPYATISSWESRYPLDVMTSEWGPAGVVVGDSDRERFAYLARVWLERARMLLAARDEAVVNLRYETLCEDLPGSLAMLAEAIPLLGAIDPSSTVEVKDYPSQPIKNMNDRQIDRLNDQQREAITGVLSQDTPTMQALGYSLR